MRLPHLRFRYWAWLIPVLIVADLAALWIWATRPERIYGEWLGLAGLLDEAPIRRLLAWARWENGPMTLSGLMSIFDAEELFIAAGLIFALLVLIIGPVAARRSEGALSRRLRSPFRMARAFGVRYRVRTALAAIAIVGLCLGWEIHGWRAWLMRTQWLGRAGSAGALENRNRALVQSKQERLAKLAEIDSLQPSEQSAPNRGFYRSPEADTEDRRAQRDRLNREITYCSALANIYAEQRSKYERAAANPWGPVGPDQPVQQPEPEPLDMLGNRDYARALAACDQLAKLYPNLVEAHSRSAWIRATCNHASFRDGKLAVASARRACELTGWRDIGELTVLAAACAEDGDFAQAVKWQQQAEALATNPRNSGFFRERLWLYRARIPYRQN